MIIGFDKDALVSPPASRKFTATFSTIKNTESYILDIWLDKYGRILPGQVDGEDIEHAVNMWLHSEAGELFETIPIK